MKKGIVKAVISLFLGSLGLAALLKWLRREADM